jgi:NAD(P)-dependent dehydrogenase (short-subunit alcohol dehydrogenase family)
VLVNNAGHNSRGPLEELPVDDMLQILHVNLRAPLVLIRLVLPTMRAQGAGTIVNVASLAGRFPLADEATYSATKFALRIFSFALADEVADLVLASAADGTRKRTKPALAGKLATLTYLIPGIRRILLPVFERKREREKKKYIARHSK